MTFEVIRLLQAFLDAIFRTAAEQMTISVEHRMTNFADYCYKWSNSLN